MEELTQQEADGLHQIRANMSRTQREEMAEIIQKEMERRGMVEPSMSKKSTVKATGMNSGLNGEQVKELYQDVGKAVQQLRVKKLEEQLSQVRAAKGQRPSARPRMKVPSTSPVSFRPVLISGVIGLGMLKIAGMTGIFDSTEATARPTTVETKVETAAPMRVELAPSAHLWTPSEKDLLTQLDARRVELERRKEALDRREQELKNQAQVVTDRLAELRGLTAKLQELRRERDNKQEGRLAQLANVYGAMEPSEAAILISRLEDPIALELLERMPEKRIGQVLGFMEKGRAVDLTKLLTEKKMVN